MAWLEAPFHRPAELRARVQVGLHGGVGGVVQRRDSSWSAASEDQAVIAEASALYGWPGLAARGEVGFGLLGVYGEVDVGLARFQHPVASHGRVAAMLGSGNLRVGVGGGVGGGLWLSAEDGAEQRRPRSEALAYGTFVGLWTVETLDGGVSVGLGPDTTRGAAFAGWTSPAGDGPARLRLGLSGGVAEGRFRLGGVDVPSDGAVPEFRTVSWRGASRSASCGG